MSQMCIFFVVMGPLTAFFRSILAAMWTKLMKLAKDKIPKELEDRGLDEPMKPLGK